MKDSLADFGVIVLVYTLISLSYAHVTSWCHEPIESFTHVTSRCHEPIEAASDNEALSDVTYTTDDKVTASKCAEYPDIEFLSDWCVIKDSAPMDTASECCL